MNQGRFLMGIIRRLFQVRIKTPEHWPAVTLLCNMSRGWSHGYVTESTLSALMQNKENLSLTQESWSFV